MNFNKKDIKKNLCRHLDSCISTQGWLFLVPFLAPPLFDFTGTLRSPCPRQADTGLCSPNHNILQSQPALASPESSWNKISPFVVFYFVFDKKTTQNLTLPWLRTAAGTTVQCNSRDMVITAVSVRIKRKPSAFFVVAKGLTPQVTGGGEKRWKFFSKI